MRFMMVAVAGAALTLAACSQGGGKTEGQAGAGETGASAPAASMEGPRPGLWRVTTSMAGLPAGATPAPVETCVSSATFEVPGGAAMSPDAKCTTQPFRREGDAMVTHTICEMQAGIKSDSTIRVTGDFSSRYTMQVTSTTTGAPAPTPETTITMNAERLGDCPGV